MILVTAILANAAFALFWDTPVVAVTMATVCAHLPAAAILTHSWARRAFPEVLAREHRAVELRFALILVVTVISRSAFSIIRNAPICILSSRTGVAAAGATIGVLPVAMVSRSSIKPELYELRSQAVTLKTQLLHVVRGENAPLLHSAHEIRRGADRRIAAAVERALLPQIFIPDVMEVMSTRARHLDQRHEEVRWEEPVVIASRCRGVKRVPFQIVVFAVDLSIFVAVDQRMVEIGNVALDE